MKYSLSTAHCDIKSKDGCVVKIHFLIESTGKDVPIIHPDNFGYARDKSSLVALQEQKETVHFSNFLDMEIHVRLSDTGLPSTNGVDCICNEATIPSRSEGYWRLLSLLLTPWRIILNFLCSINKLVSRCHKVHITLLDERASKAPLDLDALSGLTEVNLEVEGESGSKTVTKLGVSLKPSVSKVVPLQVVSMYPRYVILNESDEVITVRQCFLEEDGTDTTVTLNSKQRASLTLRSGNGIKTIKRRTLFENFLKKHAKSQNDSSFLSNFNPIREVSPGLGQFVLLHLDDFFLNSRSRPNGPTIVLRFCWPANMDLPYRIENRLENTSITYYQKEGLTEPEVLASRSSVGYVWDDLTHAHKLVV
ncbi:hypothetical protein A4A49_26823 [Nicotiana attenuata]|uniref:Vacuolar protein sorting-associated protein 13 VPS13 adaptor binding domain-containing protein n=1 Tax=Nicotiana attenuata TaxID=49451 RepID=A0A314KQL9_NICAT|nr:hypothetical protein A4A49_26823 [Nicotiana attenuata]